jgi:ribosomal protein L11 methyltransferase
MMNWIEITVHTTNEGVEAVSELFYQAGINGLVVDNPKDIEQFKSQPGDWDYVDESLLSSKEDEVLIKGYLPDEIQTCDKIHFIRNSMAELLNKELGIDLGKGIIELSNVKEEDWANNWKKYYKPHKIGKKIVIKPTWESYTSKDGDIVLELDPGMAFGTGTHETTSMCIEILEDKISPHTKLLDVGCGTGILSIAALLLGAYSAVAVDIDSNAVQTAWENAKINKVSDRISILRGNLLDDVVGKYDIVVANIIADVIIDISEYVHSYLNSYGIFIASGIILDRVQEVESALVRRGFKIIEKKTKGEWAAIVSQYE